MSITVEILLGIFSAMWILEYTIAWIAVVTGP